MRTWTGPALLIALLSGCQLPPMGDLPDFDAPATSADPPSALQEAAEADEPSDDGDIAVPDSIEDDPTPLTADSPAAQEGLLFLEDVIRSIYATYPMLEAAYRERGIAHGKVINRLGQFDTKLKAESLNQPVGFYENYRQKARIEQPLAGGGEIFAQYRIGRGFFEPWYRERQTNDGGEFKAGFLLPLLQDRRIDERRAELWKAEFAQRAVEPDIRDQLLEFIQMGSFAYWEWVAAGQNYRIAEALLENAEERINAIERRAEEGDIEPIAVVDNQRLVVSRRAKLVEAENKLRQAAIKLSLFHRAPNGLPLVPPPDALPEDFPEPIEFHLDELPVEVDRAIAIRPELQFLSLQRRQIELDLQQAHNLFRPRLDVTLVGADDVGEPTSPKRDKSPFELEGGLLFELPLQRRKARGKILEFESKLAQMSSKIQFTEDKIAAEVRQAGTAVEATFRRYQQALRALELAERMEQAEQTRFELGDSDLFLLNAREKQTAEAALEVAIALRDHFQALADLRAAVGDLPAAGPFPQIALPADPTPVLLP